MGMTLDLLRRVTDEELAALSARNPGYQFERTVEGRVTVSPTGSDGGRLSGGVFARLWNWNDQTRMGVAFDSSTGFNLPDGSCRSPDASWVRRDRWDALTPDQRKGFAPLCPDATFEVRSESDSMEELRAKIEAYIASGARIAVLIDPESRSAEVYRPDRVVERHGRAERIDLGPELPGFTLDVGALLDD